MVRADSQHKSNLELVNECDTFPYPTANPQEYIQYISTYYHFVVADQTVGYVLPSVSEVFRGIPGFELNDDAGTLTLVSGENEEERSAIIAKTGGALRVTGHFKVLEKWRNELYPVYGKNRELLFKIERAMSPLFGVVTYGAHCICYTNGHDTEMMRLWIPRRAAKKTYGGMLDNTVAGGIAVGEDPFEALVRECDEEASLPQDIVRQSAKAAGTVSYFHIRDERAGGETRLLQPECQFVYDIELPPDVVPKPNDDEVQEFYNMTVEEVREALAKGEFKPNCAIVTLDFFIRKGILTVQNEPDLIEICSRLHRRLEFPTM